MTRPPPLAFRWDGEALVPLRPRVADQHYVIGEVYQMEPVEERSTKSHAHEFAWLREAWMSLPDDLADEFPNPESLRKRALIATGWCDVRDYACSNRAEAARLASTLRGELDDYTVVIVRDAVVRVCRAKSQARNKMKAADFAASKTAIIDHVAGLLGVDPAQLANQRAAA